MKYHIRGFQGDTYEVLDSKYRSVFQGDLTDCEAWIQAQENGHFDCNIFEEEEEEENEDENKDKEIKFIAELEKLFIAYEDLLIEAMNLYEYYPNNFRKTVEKYFSQEIKIQEEYIKLLYTLKENLKKRENKEAYNEEG